jgi:hypothetical protein
MFLRHGQQMVEFFKPFLRHLASSGRASVSNQARRADWR